MTTNAPETTYVPTTIDLAMTHDEKVKMQTMRVEYLRAEAYRAEAKAEQAKADLLRLKGDDRAAPMYEESADRAFRAASERMARYHAVALGRRS